MGKKIRVHYPWLTTPPGGAFFVPSLKLEETREAGLKAAVYHQVRGKAEFGVVSGKIGVLFRIKPQKTDLNSSRRRLRRGATSS